MSYSNYPQGFPRGITVRGMPLQQAYPGRIFWVHNSSAYVPDGGIAGNDGNPGTYQKPFATLAKATAAVTANRGDIIFLTPGYSLTLPSRGSAVGDDSHIVKEGFAIVGLGSGDLRPQFIFPHVSSEFDVQGDDVALVNLWFQSSIADVLKAVLFNGGNEGTIENCLFDGDANLGFVDTIRISASVGCHILGNEMNGIATHAGTGVTDTYESAIEMNGADRAVIKDNVIYGDYTVSAIQGITGASIGITISDNLIHNIATEDISSGIDLIDGCTGMISNNMIFTGNATSGAPTMIDGASTSNMMNFGNEALGEGTWPILIGTTTST